MKYNVKNKMDNNKWWNNVININSINLRKDIKIKIKISELKKKYKEWFKGAIKILKNKNWNIVRKEYINLANWLNLNKKD